MLSLATGPGSSTIAGEDAIGRFLQGLAPEDVRLRFGGGAPSREASALRRRLGIGDPRSTIFLSLAGDGAVAALATLALTSDSAAEAAVIVRSDLKYRGYGTALMDNVVKQARARGLTTLAALVLYENLPARRMLRRLGFRQIGPVEAVMQFELDLTRNGA
jgi:acetyltransferase